MLKVTSSGKEKQLLEKSDILDLIYPIGSVYINAGAGYVSRDYPAEKFGGQWKALEWCFLYSIGNGYAAANYEGNKNGGKITLKPEQIPAHNHKEFLEVADDNSVGTIEGCGNTTMVKGGLKDSGFTTGYACGTSSSDGLTKGSIDCQEVDIMPPYYTVHAWKRIG